MREMTQNEERLWLQTMSALLGWRGAPPKEEELCDAVQPAHRGEYYDLLKLWQKEGRLAETGKGGLDMPARLGYAAGVVRRNAKGFGFLEQPDEEEDFFIPANDMGGAMNGDTVLARPGRTGRDGMRKECRVVKVLNRAVSRVIGTYRTDSRGNGMVVSDDARLGFSVLVHRLEANGASDGMKVVAEITRYPDELRPECRGFIVEVLGAPSDKGVDITAIVRTIGLRDRFPEEVLAESDRMPDAVPREETEGRKDLREEVIVTIDGDDSKDFDDAVSLTKLDGGLVRLGVHIADVSHYVRRGTRLDREALERGNSVYLPDRVIPMLPETLSNGICSLNPDVDRLALSCIMDMDATGAVVDFELAETVIRSHRRMTYSLVNRALEGDAEARETYAPFMPMLEDMARLADALKARRVHRGALELDIPEPALTLDEDGHCIDVRVAERGVANAMIEEFMLAANETVAAWLSGMEIPAVYRVHEEPDPAKMADLDAFVQPLGYHIKGLNKGVTPKMLQQLLERMEGQPCRASVNRVLLRSLQKARYSPENKGHFGLAASDYCHFTSPIRRYADLTVHRSVRAVLQGLTDAAWLEDAAASMGEVASRTSEREADAVKAERDADDLKMAEYMMGHVGEVFDGTVSGVTEFGIFVELPNTVEGLVRLSSMDDDYYEYSEKACMLVGRRTGKTYRLGDEVRVLTAAADPVSRQVDFSLVKKMHR